MKPFLQLVQVCTLLLLINTGTVQAQGVGIGTSTADTSALLDLTSSSKGLLIPRVDLASGSVKLPATALMVFNTNAGYATGTGIYINMGTTDAPQWQQLVPANSGNFVRNQTTAQPNSNFNISGNGMVYGSLDVGIGGANSNVYIKTTARDALKIESSNTGGAGIYFKNSTVIGNWRLSHVGSGNAGPGNFNLINGFGISVITAGRLGFVGINDKPEPTEALDVNGNIKASGRFMLDVSYETRETTIPGNSHSSYTIGCPAGKKAIGGGGGHRDFNSALNDIQLSYSGPDPATNGALWRVMLHNSGGSSRAIKLYCVCAKVM